jgi:hypothetical protein
VTRSIGSCTRSTPVCAKAPHSWSTGVDLKVPEHENGFFVGPSLFDLVTPEMSLCRDEIFGPAPTGVRADSNPGSGPVADHQRVRERHHDLHQRR